MNIRLVIFDLDGVLVDSAPDISLGVNATLKNFGYEEIAIPRIISFVGNGVRTLLKRSINESLGRDPEYGITNYSDNWNSEAKNHTGETAAKSCADKTGAKKTADENVFPLETFQPMVEWYRDYYTSHAVVESRLYPEVAELLRFLREKKIHVAVASNKPHSISSVIFDALNIAKYVEWIAGPEDVVHIKPDTDELDLILCEANKVEAQNPITPKQCVMVGDSASDIIAGKKFGAVTIGVLGGYGNKAKLSEQNADITVPLARDIMNLFDEENDATKNDGALQSSYDGEIPIGDKTALVAIIGRPSVGKSTFLNTATGEKVSIVSPVPQTTRNAVRGIVNTSLGQLVFVDTPGYHDSEKKFNLLLKGITAEQLDEADVILYMIDSTREQGEEEKMTAELVKPFADKTVVAINKIDLPDANTTRAKIFVTQMLPSITADRIINISAEEDTNINDVLRALYALSPVAEQLYPEEYYTDQEVNFRIAEIIREQAINRLYDEIPHAIYVDIADTEWRVPGKKLWVRAFLVVERESQKGMVIGKGAQMIKTIRVESIKECRKIFDYRVDIDLQVKVNKNWRQKDPVLAKLLSE